ncbi:MAG: hypothetical protein L7W43_11835 [Rubripirellula sp.]|nr:hypothetical protein [Rubripirellula sp.]
MTGLPERIMAGRLTNARLRVGPQVAIRVWVWRLTQAVSQAESESAWEVAVNPCGCSAGLRTSASRIGLTTGECRGKTQLLICACHGHLSEPNVNLSVGTGYLKQGK